MSSKQTIRIAQAQINPTVGDLAGNVKIIVRAMAQAAEAGAHLVTFPELALCGYPPEDLLLKPRFRADCMRALELVTKQARGITALVGFPETSGDKVYNSAVVLGEGRVLGCYRKRELPNYGVFDEVRYFEPGAGCTVLQMGKLRLALTVCEDVWEPANGMADQIRQTGADLTLNISASPYYAGKLAVRRSTLAQYAAAAGTHICYTNLVGGQDELIFDGGSMVMDPQGEVIASARRFEEDLLICDLEFTPHGPPARVPTGDQVIKLDLDPLPSPPVLPTLAPELERLETVHQALVLGTADYMRKCGFSKVVLGLSGGIDSALTAALAVEALGAENVIGVTMPSQYTSGETLGDAEQVAQNLGIELITIPIKDVYDGFLGQMAEAMGDGPPGVAGENLQARIRGSILMTLSNRFGWLVLTTGNKSETAVGYCTLYGDMAGGFAVIKDVLKTLVYELSEYLNQRAGRELIPHSTIERPPTAELRPDQKDSDSLPPYDVLDPILMAYVEQDQSLDEVAAMGFDARMVAEVIGLVDRNEYKRRQAPPGVKITPKAFGRDRRLPISNRYRASVEQL